MNKSERMYRRRDDGGLTLIEMIVTVALTSIIMAVTTYIIVEVTGETNAERQTVAGIEQAQLAEKTFTQYMRSAYKLISIGKNDLVFSTLSGVGTNDVPNVDRIEAELCTTSNKNADTLEIIFGLPQSGTDSTGLHQCIANSPSVAATLPANVTLVESFDVEPPGASAPDIFTYFSFSGRFTALTTAQAVAAPTSVAAVGINLTFLPPVGDGRDGGIEQATVLKTVTFMRNIGCVDASPSCLA